MKLLLRRNVSRCAGLAVALAGLLCTSTPVTAAQEALSADQVGRIDAIFSDYAGADSPGYAVGVVREGKLVFGRGYGMADLDNHVPITPETAFHLASLSKQFTAAAVALLIMDGKLSLETPVSKYFPQAKKFDADLRIKHLMYFTSGIPDYTTQSRRNGDPWFSWYYFTVDDAIDASLSADKLMFAPGSDWAYSNVNFMILAKIVEKASGMPFSQFVETRIFAPLGMTHSHVDDDTTLVVPHRATGYADRSNPDVIKALADFGIRIRPGTGYVRLVRTSPHYGGSGVFSTLQDLAGWDANFASGKLAGARFTELMYHRMHFQNDKDNDAFGLVFGKYRGRTMIWFAGEDLDTSTYMARFPDQQVSVYVLSNMPLGDAQQKATAVIDILFGSSETNQR